MPARIMLHASEPPSPWAGYRLCLEAETDADHICVLQDDARVSLNFAPALERIAEANPDTVVVLYLSWLPRRISMLAQKATIRREPYVTTVIRQEFLPVVGVLWPAQKARELLSWCEDNPRRLGHKDPRSDDHVAGRWATFTQQTIRFTVPSIVQHPDEEPSLIGRKAWWGKDKGRTALFFAEDASVVSW